MSKIILLGYTGMLGHKVDEVFAKNNIELYKPNIRFSDNINIINDFANTLDKNDIVINCCGIIKQRLSKNISSKNMSTLIIVNSILPLILSYKCKLIHISTDCVFSGNKGNYTETDIPDPIDIYGKSKSLGEFPEQCMILRTSIIGREKKNYMSLFEWVMKQNECNGFLNHWWNGVTTNTLSHIIYKIINKNMFKNGLYHIFSPNKINKYDIIKLINMLRKNKAIIKPIYDTNIIDHTLDTINYNFIKYFDIPYIEEQIKKLCNYKEEL